MVLGYVLSNNKTFEISIKSSEYLLYLLASFVIFFTSYFLLSLIRKLSTKKNLSTHQLPDFLKNVPDPKLWLLLSTLIFLCYAPIIFLATSELSYDSWNIISQSTGDIPVTNAHPVIFTALVGIFIKIGILANNINIGVLLFSVFQSAVLSIIFARIVVWQREIGIGFYGIVGTLLFYAILPINSFSGTVLWKDIFFAGFGLLLLQKLIQLSTKETNFFTRNNIIFFIVFAFLFCTLRNNGLYAYAIFVIAFTLLNRKNYLNKKSLSVLISPVLLSMVYLFSTSLVFGPASSVESFSVPLQQIARTVKYQGGSISKSDRDTIDEILPFSELGEKYNPNLSDPVKWVFDKSAFDKNKSKYVSLWIRLFVKYPKTYIAAFAYNTYGYVYPLVNSSTNTDLVINNADQINARSQYSDYAYQWGGKKILLRYRDIISSTFPLMRNIGFYTILIVFAFYFRLLRKTNRLDGAFILLLSLFITVILGPVNGEFRYLYLFVVAIPIIYSTLFIKSNRSIMK